MIEEVMTDAGDATPVEPPKAAPKVKREILRFNGESPLAINLDHVTRMKLDGKKILFWFYEGDPIPVDFEEEDAALSAFQVVLGVWVAGVK